MAAQKPTPPKTPFPCIGWKCQFYRDTDKYNRVCILHEGKYRPVWASRLCCYHPYERERALMAARGLC